MANDQTPPAFDPEQLTALGDAVAKKARSVALEASKEHTDASLAPVTKRLTEALDGAEVIKTRVEVFQERVVKVEDALAEKLGQLPALIADQVKADMEEPRAQVEALKGEVEEHQTEAERKAEERYAYLAEKAEEDRTAFEDLVHKTKAEAIEAAKAIDSEYVARLDAAYDRVAKAEEAVLDLTGKLTKARADEAANLFDSAQRQIGIAARDQQAIRKEHDALLATVAEDKTERDTLAERMEQAEKDLNAEVRRLEEATKDLATTSAEKAVVSLTELANQRIEQVAKTQMDLARAARRDNDKRIAKLGVKLLDQIGDKLKVVSDEMLSAKRAMAASRAHSTKADAKRATEFEASMVKWGKAVSALKAMADDLELRIEQRLEKLEKEWKGPRDTAQASSRLNWRGAWSERETYKKGDLAVFQGTTWIAIEANKDTRPSVSDNNPWEVFAAAGMGGGYTGGGKGGGDWPRAQGVWGFLGGPKLQFTEVESPFDPWTPNRVYYAGQKAYYATGPDSGVFLRRINAGTARPDFDLTERAEWQFMTPDVWTVTTVAERDLIPAVEGTLATVTDVNEVFQWMDGAWREATQLPDYTLTDRVQRLEYDPSRPAGDQLNWVDDRATFAVVADLAELHALDAIHLDSGKLVYVKSEGLIYEFIADAVSMTNSAADWQPLVGGVTYVGREGDLPDPATDTIVDGQLFAVRMDFGGKELYRLASWDENMPASASFPPNLLTFTAAENNQPIGTPSTATIDVGGGAGVLNAVATLDVALTVDGTAYPFTVAVAPGDNHHAIAVKLAQAWTAAAPVVGVTATVTDATVTFTGVPGSAALPAGTASGTAYIGMVATDAALASFLGTSRQIGDYVIATTPVTAPDGTSVPADTAVIVAATSPLRYYAADAPTPLPARQQTTQSASGIMTDVASTADLSAWLNSTPAPGDFAYNAGTNPLIAGGFTVTQNMALIATAQGFAIADQPVPLVQGPDVQVVATTDLGQATTLADLTALPATPVDGTTVDLQFDAPTLTLPGQPGLDGAAIHVGDWAIFADGKWTLFAQTAGVTGESVPAQKWGAWTGTGNTAETFFRASSLAAGFIEGDWVNVATSGVVDPAWPLAGNLAGEQVNAGDAIVILDLAGPVYTLVAGGGDATAPAGQAGTATVAGTPVAGAPPPAYRSVSVTVPGTLVPQTTPIATYTLPQQPPATAPVATTPSVPQVPSQQFDAPSTVTPGSIGATVVPPGGGWRYLNRRVWDKGVRADPDQSTDQRPDDLQVTRERDHQELKAWNADTQQWDVIYSRDEINAAIAALSLFEGTAMEVGGTAIGAVQFDQLPDLSAMTATGDLSQVSHYWTFIGTPNTVVTPATPNIGSDLNGAVLNPGDWLQISNKGGDGSGTGANGAAPDLRWVTVGGDLLAKARADRLFGLQPWSAGGWEQGTLVVYKGDIYRATQPVTASDPNPLPAPLLINTPLSGTAHADLDGSPFATLPTSPTSGDVETATAPGQIPAGGSPFSNRGYGAGDTFVYSSDPALQGTGTTQEGYSYDQGWIAIGTTSPVPDPFTVTVAGGVTPWAKVDVTGGLKVAGTDAQRPATAPSGEVWIVLQSAAAGGKQALYSYDQGAQVWQELGGGGVPLDLTGGDIVYPRSFYWDTDNPSDLSSTGNAPQPSIVGDALFTKVGAGNPMLIAISKDGTTWSRYHPHRQPIDARGGGLPAKADYPGQPSIFFGSGTAVTTHIANRSLDWVPAAGGGLKEAMSQVAADHHSYTPARDGIHTHHFTNRPVLAELQRQGAKSSTRSEVYAELDFSWYLEASADVEENVGAWIKLTVSFENAGNGQWVSMHRLFENHDSYLLPHRTKTEKVLIPKSVFQPGNREARMFNVHMETKWHITSRWSLVRLYYSLKMPVEPA